MNRSTAMQPEGATETPRPLVNAHPVVIVALALGLGIFGLWFVVALVAPATATKLREASIGKAKVDLLCLEYAIKEYAITHEGRFPRSLDELSVLQEREHRNLSTLDPWGHAYQYEPPTPRTVAPTLYSLGSDGIPGGTGLAADITIEDVRDAAEATRGEE